MSDYARNQNGPDAGLLMSNWESAEADPGGFPDLVYSNWLDEFFPCRIIATGGGLVFIEALYHGQAVKMRVPAAIVYRRPARGGSDRASITSE